MAKLTGMADGVGDGVGLALIEGLDVGLALGVDVDDADAVAVDVGLALGVEVVDAVAVGVLRGAGELEGDGLGEGCARRPASILATGARAMLPAPLGLAPSTASANVPSSAAATRRACSCTTASSSATRSVCSMRAAD